MVDQVDGQPGQWSIMNGPSTVASSQQASQRGGQEAGDEGTTAVSQAIAFCNPNFEITR